MHQLAPLRRRPQGALVVQGVQKIYDFTIFGGGVIFAGIVNSLKLSESI